MERPASNGAANGTALVPLWGEIDIPIIMGTGEFGQGKTLFGLMICPGPQTLCYDNEGSSLSYRSLDFEHVDMADELRKKYKDGFTPEQRYLWWKEDALSRGKKGGRAGKFRVMMTDPMSEIEDGVAEHVRKNCVAKYGLSVAQCEKAPGLFWAAVKKQLQADLDLLRTHFDCCYGTVHMRDQYVGNSRTGKREPKGKETLFQLASLFLEFEREKDKKGNVAAVPSATVLKQRLIKTLFINGEMQIVPVLPPRLPAATPKTIREYIAAPPDYEKLKAGERVREHELSEEDKLRLQAQIAASQAEAATAELSRIDRINAAAAAQAAKQQATPAPDASSGFAERARERAASANAPVSADRVGKLVTLLDSTFGEEQWDDFAGQQLATLGAERISLLTDSQADGFESAILAAKAEQQQVALASQRAAIEATPDPHNSRADKSGDPPFEPTKTCPEPIGGTGQSLVTEQQIASVVALLDTAFADDAEIEATMPQLLRSIHDLADDSTTVRDLTAAQCDQLIRVLQERATARQVGQQPSAGRPAGEADDAPDSITPEQLDRIGSLTEECGVPYETQLKFLEGLKCGSHRNLSRKQAQDRLDYLAKVQAGFKGGVPGNS